MTQHKRNASPTWPLADELAVQTLYLVDGFSPKQISQSLTRPYNRVRALIARRGWAVQRRAKADQSSLAIDAHSRAHIQRVVQAQAVLAESASVASLTRTKEALALPINRDNANAVRAYAGSSRDLVNIARLSRGLDAAQQQQGGTNLTLAMFLVKGERELKNVAEATPAQVTLNAVASPVATGQ